MKEPAMQGGKLAILAAHPSVRQAVRLPKYLREEVVCEAVIPSAQWQIREGQAGKGGGAGKNRVGLGRNLWHAEPARSLMPDYRHQKGVDNQIRILAGIMYLCENLLPQRQGIFCDNLGHAEGI